MRSKAQGIWLMDVHAHTHTPYTSVVLVLAKLQDCAPTISDCAFVLRVLCTMNLDQRHRGMTTILANGRNTYARGNGIPIPAGQ